MASDPTLLTQSFTYQDKFLVKWTRLGPSSAQPIVFVHGTPWSSRVWAPFAHALSRTYNVYLFDNPGYGESRTLGAGTEEQRDDGPLIKQAEVFAALVKHWNLSQPPHVIAHDNGGLCSLRATLQCGLKYRSLLLVDVVAAGPWGLPFFALVASNASIFEQIPLPLFAGLVRGYARSASFKGLSQEAEDMLAEQWSRDEEGRGRFVRNIVQASRRRSDDVEGRYKELREQGVPVQVIWGKDDTWLPCERAEKLAQLLGNDTNVILLEEAGHLIQLDQPVQLMCEIVRFIERVEGQS